MKHFFLMLPMLAIFNVDAKNKLDIVDNELILDATRLEQDNSLVLWYNFENDSSNQVFDSSPNLLHSQVKGSKQTANGVVGKALFLDSSDEDDHQCLNLGSPSPTNVDTYTLMSWVNADTTSGIDPERMEVVEKTGSYWMNIRNTNDKAVNGLPVVRCGGLFKPEEKLSWYFADTPFGLEASTWHHLACTWDGDRFEIYVDGLASHPFTWKGSVIEEFPEGSESPEALAVFELSEVPAGSELIHNDLPLVIGCKYDVKAEDYVAQLEGRLDELKIYNRALSAEEMKAVFNSEAYKQK